MTPTFDMPIRALTKAEVAQIMEYQTEGLTWVEISKRVGKRIQTMRSAVERAKFYGYQAWEKVEARQWT